MTAQCESLELCASKIRWFYKDETCKKWVPFGGYDTLKIETAFLKQNGRTFPAKSFRYDSPLLVRGSLFEVNVNERKCFPIYWEEKPVPILRGSWFRDPGGPQCTPIEDELMAEQLEIMHIKLLRNLAVEALDCSNSNELSNFCQQTNNNDKDKSSLEYRPLSSIFLSSSKLSVIHTAQFADCHVEWYSPEEIYLYMETTSLYICQKLGMPKVGTRLGRGYFESADLEDKDPEVAHLCFVVHGMGQKFLKGSIIKSCDEMRNTSNKLLASYFPDVTASQKRVEFLPVEWRNSLLLDGDVVDSLTLNNLSRLRYFLNSTFMDIMYYTSPLYRFEISRNLLDELNRLYTLFLDRHRYFEANGGRVSIVCHSLGCVIAYDLITGWIDPIGTSNNTAVDESPLKLSITKADTNGLHVADPASDFSELSILRAKLEAAKEVVKCLESQLSVASADTSLHPAEQTNGVRSIHCLKFASRLENLICAGSPLPIYLTLRGIRPGNTSDPDKVMPRSCCRHIYNVFHPSDPVAYRLEPLILKHYSTLPPVDIYRCNDPAKISYQTAHLNSISKRIPQNKSAPSSLFNSTASRSSSPLHHSTSPDHLSTKQPDSAPEVTGISRGLNGRLSLTNLLLGFFRGTTDEMSRPTESYKQTRAKRSKSSSVSSTISSFMPLTRFEIAGDEEVSSDDGAASDGDRNRDEDLPLSKRIKSSSSPSADSIDLEYRMDYQLRESRYENTYLSALTVHTSYWSNADFILFVLMQIFTESTPLDNPTASG